MSSLLPAALHLASPLPQSPLPQLSQALLRQLVQAALTGTLLVLAVWLLCRLAPRLPAGLRCTLWWLASLKLVLGLAWPAPLVLPLLPAAVGPAAGWLAAPPPAAPSAPAPPARLAGDRLAPGALGRTEPVVPPSPASLRTLLTSAHLAGKRLAAGPSGATASVVPLPGTRGSAPPLRARVAPPGPRSGAPAFAGGLAPARTTSRPPTAGPAAAAQPWWAMTLAALWLAGVLRQAALTARELRLVRRFLQHSEPVTDQGVLALAADLRGNLGLPPVELRASPADALLAAPLTARALRPVVVLPAAGIGRMSRQELAMTLGHELMHVRRRDLLWGWIPAAAARLFFFLPPAAWAAREYALAREAACDAAVLRLLGASPASYGRLLLRLGVRPAAGRRPSRTPDLAQAAATAGGAAASMQQLKRRLEMLQHSQHDRHDLDDAPPRANLLRRLGLSLLALLALAALVPLRIVTAASSPAIPAAACKQSRSLGLPQPPRSPAACKQSLSSGLPQPPRSPAAGASVQLASLRGQSSTGAAAGASFAADDPNELDDLEPPTPPAAAPAPPAPAVLPAPPAPPASAEPPAPPTSPAPPAPLAPPAPPSEVLHAGARWGGSSHVHSDRSGRHDEDSYVLLHDGSDVTMSGDMESVERARALQRQAGGGDLLWVRHGGKEYQVRDAATLAEVRQIFRPQAELGARQGKLGGEQGELGARQGELGSRQGALGGQQGKLGAQQALLAAEQAKLTAEDLAGGDRGSAAREKRRDELVEQQQRLAGEMRKLGEQQRELGSQQRELGEAQRRLGDQQRELGRQQERAAREAQVKLDALLTRTIASGIAQPVK